MSILRLLFFGGYKFAVFDISIFQAKCEPSQLLHVSVLNTSLCLDPHR
jgi:hypothetical protein